MARRLPDAGRAALAALLCLAAAAAQAAPTTFRTPDGSRFVLIPDPSIPQVHWALASPCDASSEPPGYEGLAWATAQVSLHGTWRSGSRDAEQERAALARLDEAWQRLMRDTHDPAAAANVRRRDEEARAFADLTVFPRLLAAAPVHRPEVLARGPVAVLVLTTLPAAIGEVGRLLVERREQQPLRELPRAWLQVYAERTQQYVADARRPVRTEVLALTMPDLPAARSLEPPATGSPTREQAFAVWAATQHPDRTVHVLLGDFDAAAVRKVLEATFAATALPATPAPPAPAPRPLAGARRSAVDGVAVPMVALAWVLPPIADPFVLATAVRHLADGPDSWLGQELHRRGRTSTTVRGTAPWPPTPGGQSLLLVEATDPAGVAGVADVLLAACKAAAAKEPEAAALQAVTASLQRQWREAHSEPRQLAAEIAANALAWPLQAPATEWPEAVAPKAIAELLARTFAGHPVIVEGRR